MTPFLVVLLLLFDIFKTCALHEKHGSFLRVENIPFYDDDKSCVGLKLFDQTQGKFGMKAYVLDGGSQGSGWKCGVAAHRNCKKAGYSSGYIIGKGEGANRALVGCVNLYNENGQQLDMEKCFDQDDDYGWTLRRQNNDALYMSGHKCTTKAMEWCGKNFGGFVGTAVDHVGGSEYNSQLACVSGTMYEERTSHDKFINSNDEHDYADMICSLRLKQETYNTPDCRNRIRELCKKKYRSEYYAGFISRKITEDDVRIFCFQIDAMIEIPMAGVSSILT